MLFIKDGTKFDSCISQTNSTTMFAITSSSDTYTYFAPITPTANFINAASLYKMTDISLTFNTGIVVTSILSNPCSGSNVMTLPVSYSSILS
jgi:hypothetical protein